MGIIYHVVATIPYLNLIQPHTNEEIFNPGIKKIKKVNTADLSVDAETLLESNSNKID